MEELVQVETPKPAGRDHQGRFLKGNQYKTDKAHRNRKIDSRPILEAITEEFSVVEIRSMLRKAYKAAEVNDDAKMMLEVVRFVAAYAIGKPVQRSIEARVSPEDFARLFRGDEMSDEEEVIDVD